MTHLLRAVVDLLLPPVCEVCGHRLTYDERVICEACWARVEPFNPPLCVRCGRPSDKKVCDTCREQPLLPRRVRAIGNYDGILKEAIHLLKYNHRLSVASRLAQYLADIVAEEPEFQAADYLVPVPLHPTRERERGYNQAYVIAYRLSLLTGIPVLNNVLRRTRYTKDQIDLPKELRKSNVWGAFRVTDADKIRDKTIILVDDVFTTGATLNACTQVLVEAGVHEVYGLACATPV